MPHLSISTGKPLILFCFYFISRIVWLKFSVRLDQWCVIGFPLVRCCNWSSPPIIPHRSPCLTWFITLMKVIVSWYAFMRARWLLFGVAAASTLILIGLLWDGPSNCHCTFLMEYTQWWPTAVQRLSANLNLLVITNNDAGYIMSFFLSYSIITL